MRGLHKSLCRRERLSAFGVFAVPDRVDGRKKQKQKLESRSSGPLRHQNIAHLRLYPGSDTVRGGVSKWTSAVGLADFFLAQVKFGAVWGPA